MADTEEKRPSEGRRVRSMLKSYYGVADADSSTSSDPSNIDTAAFDPDRYFDGLLKVSSLSELVSKDGEMVSEIKSLDGDMKTLVYENYNKFISATDTIRKMKSNVENMEAEMVHLSKNMDKITECSDRINNTLSTRRDKIEQLSGVHRLLQKLQFLVALPSRLTQCIQMQSYAQAVKYYTITGGILGQYNHLPSFNAIHIECNRIIDELRVKLRDRIKDSETPPPEVSEAADLLIELNEPTDVLRGLYLSGRRTSVESLLKKYADQEPKTLSAFIPDFVQQFLAALLYTQQSYRSLFINRFDTSGLTYAEKEVSSKMLDEFGKDMFARFVSIVKSKFSGDHPPKEKMLGLEALHSAVQRVNAQIPELSAADKIASIVDSTVHSQVDNYIVKLQTAVAGHIQAMCEALAESKTQTATPQAAADATLSFSELSERTCKAIVSEIHALYDSVRPFMASDYKFLATHYGVLFSKIQVKMQQFFLFLNVHMLEYIGEGGVPQHIKGVKISARFVLQLVGVALYIETRGLQQVSQLNNDLASLAQKKGVSTSGDLSVFNAQDLAKRIREIAQKLLSNYVRMQGTKVSAMLRKGIEITPNWLKGKEPREVRYVIDVFIDEITKVAQEINVVFNAPTAAAATVGSSPPTPTLSTSTNNVNSGRPIARTPTMPSFQATAVGTSVRKNASVGTNLGTLFDKKVNIFAPVEFNANSVIIGIVNIGMKTMYECVRLRTFGKNGYQQIQVDLYCMKTVLWSIIGKNTTVDQLVDEVERSVVERCIDPTPMEQSIITKLCEVRQEKRNASSSASSQ